MVLKSGKDIRLAQVLELIVVLDPLICPYHSLCLRPARVWLEIQGFQYRCQLIHCGLTGLGLLFGIGLFQFNDILFKKLTSLVFVIGGSKGSLTFNDGSNSLPATVVLDFRMTLQHGVEICSEFSESFLRPILFMHANLASIFLKSCFAIFWILESTILRILDSLTHCLLPRPVRFDVMALKHFYECTFCFFGRTVLWLFRFQGLRRSNTIRI